MSSVVEFYRGRALDSGLSLVDLWEWTPGEFDANPGALELLFPLVDADTARIFVWDEVLRDRLLLSLETAMKFFGLERLSFPNGRVLVLRAATFPERRPLWVQRDSENHNQLTRMLGSLRQLGLEHEARALFRCLEDVYREEGRDIISPDVFYGWRDAAGR